MRRTLIGVGAIGAVILWLHLAHALVGHLAFVRFGPPAAVALAVACSGIFVPGSWRAAEARWTRAALSAFLTWILVVPEWVEGELASGHGLSAAALADHGESVVGVLAVVAVALMVWEARRLQRALL